ncbi:MAG TPA: hypothetical protein VKB95_07065 [Chitinophagaceae bacterium]|nr:hypothetical protein [Chitinophagaceae bacterium]
MSSNKFYKAVLTTGLIAGALDATAASIQFYINTNKEPVRVFRYIASAVFGAQTKTGGLYSWGALGLLFHFLIATTWALIFFLCYRQIKKLIGNKYVAGIVYALFVWCIMNFLVVPIAFHTDLGMQATNLFSQARLKNSLIAMGILIIAIGLPISLLANRYYSKNNSGVT